MRQNLLIFLILLSSNLAKATLGELSETPSSQKANNISKYSVTETLSEANSGLSKVREFKDSSGKVFGVCWSGQRPQKYITQLLGSHYFSEYKKAVALSASQKGKKFLVVKSDAFVLKVVDHGRSHRGCAYDPQLVPSGVNANEIK